MMFLDKIKIIICLLLVSNQVYSSWNRAQNLYNQRGNSMNKTRGIILELVSDKKYFSSVPYLKEYLTSTTRNLDSAMERALADVILEVGVKQFEILPNRFLKRSNAGILSYVLAKKYLNNGQLDKALNQLGKINRSEYIYPFSKNLEGTIHALKGSNIAANSAFQSCISSSRSASRKDLLNKDYCRLGLARIAFQAKKFDDSDLLYLDIPKSSYVWPEVLFEEAWNSYYQKNYNRSLGKLVSYKAPVFDYIFNPEIEVLKALSYLKLCLYQDAREVHKDFYSTYYRDAVKLRRFINKYKRSHKVFYTAMLNHENNQSSSFSLLDTLLKNIEREVVYRDLRKQLVFAAKEYEELMKKPNTRFKRLMVQNISDVIITQKKIIGSYIRGQLISFYAKLYKAFEGMSYIKLESLKKEKESLYNFDPEKKSKRGDIQYIERNQKQYFWDFNGEFWADELGDYVFALRSECR